MTDKQKIDELESRWFSMKDWIENIEEQVEQILRKEFGGPTLRQRYKMAALAGIASGDHDLSVDEIAFWTGQMADAMLAEDEKHKEEKK